MRAFHTLFIFFSYSTILYTLTLFTLFFFFNRFGSIFSFILFGGGGWGKGDLCFDLDLVDWPDQPDQPDQHD